MGVNMICAGNWKLNKNPLEAKSFIHQLLQETQAEEQAHLVVIPPALCLDAVTQALLGTSIRVGGQNCHWHLNGAFTGENSAASLATLGASVCLVGHSERRQLFAEADEMLAKKVKTVQSQKLIPILCIGESLIEREREQTNSILERQLQQGLSEAEKGAALWLAYEPVWAIGTGRVATTAQVADAHLFIRQWLQKNRPDLHVAPLLYGGSVKPDNAGELAKQPNVDGFLIGGASLEVSSFLGILRAAKN
jgi:triosephosphate isomerase